jgi:uncharacterized protein DUF3344
MGTGRRKVALALLAGLVVSATGSVVPAAAAGSALKPIAGARSGARQVKPARTGFRHLARNGAPPEDATGSLSTVSVGTLHGGYVAAGIGLRNLGYGTISIAGIPSGAKVASATLLWDIVADSADASFAKGTFAGNEITGTAWGSGTSPCWPPAANFSYEADVTKRVTGNGSYALSGFTTGESDGADPWNVGSTPPLLEGATLIVVYKLESEPLTTVQIAAGASEIADDSATATMTGFTADTHPKATTTYIVADGQQTGIKSATFNGDTVPNATFTGTDPLAVADYSTGNLWDTTTADVSSSVKASDTSASLSITSATDDSGYYDCVVWVGQVLAVSQVNVGIYSDLNTSPRVTEALDNGWTTLGSVSGQANPKNTHDSGYRKCGAPWTGSTGADAAVSAGVSAYLQNQPTTDISWVSYWTSAVPPYSKDANFLESAGYAAGVHAAKDAEAAAKSTHVLPTYIALDFEESPSAFSCGTNREAGQKKPKPDDKQCWDWDSQSKEFMNCFLIDAEGWRQFALGWARGVNSAVEDLAVSPAIYVTRDQFKNKAIGSIGLPVIMAVGLPPSKTPPEGGVIVGYAAFYSSCEDVSINIAKVESWDSSTSSSINTLQLTDKGVDCTPAGKQQSK